jgi:hypothetical protein
MDDFKIVIDGKECSCAKCDKVYVELDSSVERNDIDYEELNSLVEFFSIPRETISFAMRIKKKSPNYKRMRKFFKKLIKECKQNEN